MQLVVLAAGRGSRFGGEKQWSPIPGLGKTLLELNIEDAAEAGFQRAVLIVGPHADRAIADRINLPVTFCVQDRPLGTAHALFASQSVVNTAFVTINADDYYGGPTVFERLAAHLSQSSSWALAGYRLGETLSNHGPVNRAACRVDASGLLVELVEHQNLTHDSALPMDTLVSMNAWGFKPQLFSLLQRFLSIQLPDGKEYELPAAIEYAMKQHAVDFQVLEAGSRWLGVTYKEDMARVARELGKC